MSGFAFSPQFSQRWLATSHAVKKTIIQELADIHSLLRYDTPADEFHFHVNNLHDEIEFILEEETKAEAFAREQEAKRQEELRLAQEQAERERAEQERLAKLELVKSSVIEQVNHDLEPQLQSHMERLKSELQVWIDSEVERRLQERLPKAQ